MVRTEGVIIDSAENELIIIGCACSVYGKFAYIVASPKPPFEISDEQLLYTRKMLDQHIAGDGEHDVLIATRLHLNHNIQLHSS